MCCTPRWLFTGALRWVYGVLNQISGACAHRCSENIFDKLLNSDAELPKGKCILKIIDFNILWL